MYEIMPIGFWGEVYRWSISKASGIEGWRFQWWRIIKKQQAFYQARSLQVIRRYFSGFCSWGRGLYWDRRTRYGEK